MGEWVTLTAVDGFAAPAYVARPAGQPAAALVVLQEIFGVISRTRAASMLSGVRAAVPYYGGGMTTPPEVAREPRCPVLAHFGEQDHAIPLEGVLAFQKAQPRLKVALYNAPHGFNCDQRGDYNATAASAARQRTLAFLRQHLA